MDKTKTVLMIQELCSLWLIVPEAVMRESASGCSMPFPTQSTTGCVRVQQIRYWPAHLLSPLSAGQWRTVAYGNDGFPLYVNTTCDFYLSGTYDGIREQKTHVHICPSCLWVGCHTSQSALELYGTAQQGIITLLDTHLFLLMQRLHLNVSLLMNVKKYI